MSSSINRWGEDVPEPLSVFNYRVINPKNIEIAERREKSKVLPKRELKRVEARKRELADLLNAVGFLDKLAEFQRLSGHLANLRVALETAKPGEERERMEADRVATEATIARLRAEHGSSIAAYKEYQKLAALLDDHVYAVMQLAVRQQIEKELAREVDYFEEIIISTWARLGFKHDTLDKRGRRVVNRVSFSDRQIVGADQIWYKIATTSKTWTGHYKSILPYGVRVADLVREDTCFEVSTAAQRQVTSVANQNGAWIVLNRLNTVDGIKTYVTYEELMKGYRKSDSHFLPIPMGVGLREEVSWVFLAQYPHILIGGTTGGGKSNIINVIVSTLAGWHSPDEVQLVLIDLKEGLEFQHYENIPHLMRKVVLTVEDAATVMLQLEALRAERGKMLYDAGVKDLDEYNEVMERRGGKTQPRVVVVFDEFAAIDNPFALDMKKSIIASAMQLTNKARAAGIHLIICTQRPSVDVVPGHIKDNMAFRIAGAMPTQAASTTILGVGDAATLPLIKGRMMAMAGALKWQLQTPHIKKMDIDQAVRKAMEWAKRAPVEKVALPAATGSLGFGEDDLLHLVMDDYGGRLKLIAIWEQMKDTGLVSHNELHKLGKALKAKPSFEYEGVTYTWRTVEGNSVVAMPVAEGSQEAV